MFSGDDDRIFNLRLMPSSWAEVLVGIKDVSCHVSFVHDRYRQKRKVSQFQGFVI